MDNFVFQTIFINPNKSKNDRITVIDEMFDDQAAAISIFRTSKYKDFYGVSLSGQKANIKDFIRELDTLDYQLLQHSELNLLKKMLQIAKAKGLGIVFINKPAKAIQDDDNINPAPETMMQYMNDKRAEPQQVEELKTLLDSVASVLINRGNIDLAYDVIQAYKSIKE